VKELRGNALLFANKVVNDEADAGHAQQQETDHDQDCKILGLSGAARGINFACRASQRDHDREVRKRLNNDFAGFSDGVPDAVSQQQQAGPAGDVADGTEAKFCGFFWHQTCPQPESSVTDQSEEKEDVVEVFE
jgi:hypothetical protein